MRKVDKLRAFFFTNKTSERLLLSIQKIPSFRTLSFKFLAGNHLYPKNTIRKVKRKGINYQLDIHDYQEWLIYTNAETDSSRGVINFLSDSKIIFDVGANIGQTSLWMEKYVKTKEVDYQIYAFEPHPATFKKFTTNLALNPFSKIAPFNVGLGNFSSELELIEDCETNSGGFRIGKISPTQKGVKIPVSTIDEFVLEHKVEKVDFIKIDVEGFEHHILLGGINTLKKHLPKLYIEFCPKNIEVQGFNPKELIQFLESMNYTLTDVNNLEGKTDWSKFEGMTDIYCEREQMKID